jgi:hypothetical protein
MLRRLAALSIRASNCPFFCNFGRLLAATLIDRRNNIVFIKISINAYDKQRWIVLSCI